MGKGSYANVPHSRARNNTDVYGHATAMSDFDKILMDYARASRTRQIRQCRFGALCESACSVVVVASIVWFMCQLVFVVGHE